MKVVCLLLLGVVAFCLAPAADAVQLDRIALQTFTKVHGTRCDSLHCPYDNAICCKGSARGSGGRKGTCCPNGYKCSYLDQRPTTCVKAKPVSVTINPTLSMSGGSAAGQVGSASMGSVSAPSMSGSVDPMSSTSGMPSSGSGSAADPMASSAGLGSGSGSAAMPVGSSGAPAPEQAGAASNVPKFRQNIIIVKNINVLTKLQQPPKAGGASSEPTPTPAQDSSSASGSASAASASASSEESSEESSQSS